MNGFTGDGAPQAGWYPDPVHISQWRWWDGTGWTTHTTPRTGGGPETPQDRTWSNVAPAAPPFKPEPGYFASGPSTFVPGIADVGAWQQTQGEPGLPGRGLHGPKLARKLLLGALAAAMVASFAGRAVVGVTDMVRTPDRRDGGQVTAEAGDGAKSTPGSAANNGSKKPKSGGTDGQNTPEGGWPDNLAGRSAAEIERFWAGEYPRVGGGKWRPLGPDRLIVGRVKGVSDSCGGRSVPKEANQGNAFYCGDDYVTYDPEFVSQLADTYGEAAAAVVFAHEWGHRVQTLSDGMPRVGLVGELQADCYAGAWSAWQERDGRLGWTQDQRREALTATLAFRDPVSLQYDDPQAHGTGFDRASAFRVGWSEGTGACADMAAKPPATVQGVAVTGGGNGNLPLATLTETTLDMLDAASGDKPLAAPVHGDCATVACAGNGTITVDDKAVSELYTAIGDFAAGAPIVDAYLDAQAARRGDEAPGRDAKDCSAGAFAGSLLGGLNTAKHAKIYLDGRDLDELLLGMLRPGGDQGDVFERLDSVRRGFDRGWDACR